MTILEPALALVGGAALGLFFIGGLRLTLSRLPHARYAGLLVLGSFVVRASVVVAGIVLLAAGDWRRVLAALVGFVAARTLLVRIWGRKPAVATG